MHYLYRYYYYLTTNVKPDGLLLLELNLVASFSVRAYPVVALLYENISLILVTLLVSKLLKSRLVALLDENIFFILTIGLVFTVSHNSVVTGSVDSLSVSATLQPVLPLYV